MVWVLVKRIYSRIGEDPRPNAAISVLDQVNLYYGEARNDVDSKSGLDMARWVLISCNVEKLQNKRLFAESDGGKKEKEGP
jgi:hypothetical protein